MEKHHIIMSLNAYLRLKGSDQGEIKGSVNQKGKEGSIFVHAASHQLVAPTALVHAGGSPGKLHHQPFKLIKETDRSTPMLYKALVNNEILSEFRLDFYRQTGNAVLVQNVYSVRLINPRIIAIDFTMPHALKPEENKLNEFEEITFVYEKIEWQWYNGNAVFDTEWQ